MKILSRIHMAAVLIALAFVVSALAFLLLHHFDLVGPSRPFSNVGANVLAYAVGAIIAGAYAIVNARRHR